MDKDLELLLVPPNTFHQVRFQVDDQPFEWYVLELLGFDKEIGKYTCFESDLWAAACITYFMLSGLPPFQAQRYVLTGKFPVQYVT